MVQPDASPAPRRVAVDAGGIPLASGGRMRADVVFRVSGALVRQEELARLEALQLDLLVDLRGGSEHRDVLVAWARAHGVRYVNAPIAVASPEHLAKVAEGATEADGFAQLRLIYQEIVDRHAGSIARTLALIPGTRRAGFGCAAGKDRTGLVTAFLHILLGASDEQAAEHYVALAPTPEQLAPLVKQYFGLEPGTPVPPAVTGLFGVGADILLDTLQDLRRRHGTIEQYLFDAGLPPEVPEQLRRQLVDRQ